MASAFSSGAEALLYFAVSTGASVIGSLCGIGGGIIIKPLLDFIGSSGVDTVSFLSSCTVLTMSTVSVLLSMIGKKKDVQKPAIRLSTCTPLAAGAVLGGTLGQALFQTLKSRAGDIALVGAAQSFALFLTTLASLLYALFSDRIKGKNMNKALPIAAAGVVLGIVASFIGIGGGPINIMMMSYFFSMKTKEAAANSLYVVMFSQGASLAHVLFTGAVPEFGALSLALMMAGGVAGALAGKKINEIISSAGVRALYIALMLAIILVSCKNFHFFVS